MKRVIVLAVIALMSSAVTVNAQKMGHINFGELVSVMPETKKAQDKMQKMQDSLNMVYAEMIREYNEKDSIIRVDSAKWTQAKKDIKFSEYQKLAEEVQQYSGKAQQWLQAKEQEIYAPVQKAALDAIQAVAKANGYAYVFTKDALLAAPPADDILPLVKKYLKIPETSQAQNK
ncbi:MAG: OmpH family outer membrane protein [Chitinophagaceae bacterium]|nr:OmpH family outer membrane protein [Chitinophagaceae bacterium]